VIDDYAKDDQQERLKPEPPIAAGAAERGAAKPYRSGAEPTSPRTQALLRSVPDARDVIPELA